MSDNNTHKWFNQLKKDSEKAELSQNHTAKFEERLKTSKPKQNLVKLSTLYKIAAVFILGIALVPLLNNNDGNMHPEYQKYQETKSYFTAYIEYEVGRHKEEMTPENEALILSAIQEVLKLKYDYTELEKEFIQQDYDKRILKRMIDNFRQQLDILERIDDLLESTKPTTTQTDENII